MVLFFAIILLIHYVDVNTQQYDQTSVHNSMESNENQTHEFDLLKLNNIFLDDLQYVQMLNDLHNPMPRRFRRDTKYPTNNNNNNNNNSTNTRNKTNNNRKQQKNDPSSSSSMSASLITPTSTLSPVSRNKATTRKSYKTTSSIMANKRQTTVPNKAPTTLALNGNNKNKVKPSAAPTKYHYYPHNQHIYFLPECAIQQVCNAVYVRLNYTQPLCACPPRYRDPCSASLNEDDNHTIKLVGNQKRKAFTLAKTCESTNELRECRAPKDWSILALQNTRTGKSHYLVICKCPSNFRLEGPLAHDQPTYAGLPGINVYGMLCVPPEKFSAKPGPFNKWKENDSNRPAITSSYRSKNSTVLAT